MYRYFAQSFRAAFVVTVLALPATVSAQVSASDTVTLNASFSYVSSITAPANLSMSLDGVDADNYEKVDVGNLEFSLATSNTDVQAEVTQIDGTNVTTSPVDTVFVTDAANYLTLGVADDSSGPDTPGSPFWDGTEYKTVTLIDSSGGGGGALTNASSIEGDIGEYAETMYLYLQQVGNGPSTAITTDVVITYTVIDP